MRLLFLLFISMIFAEISLSHSGGLNQQGCHNNRKTGGYHCHRSKSVQQLKKYNCKIVIGDQYYEFDPSRTNDTSLKFKKNNGEVKLSCF